MRRHIVEVFLGFNAVTAIVGGLGLMTDLLAPPSLWLSGTIFGNYVVPGMVLALLVGGSALFAYIAFQRSDKYAPIIGMISGILMCGWIVNEAALIRQFAWLQLLYFASGAAIIGLTYTDTKELLIHNIHHPV